MPRLRINEGIRGGIRNPHFHVADEIVLLDDGRFKELVGQVAKELAKDLLEEEGRRIP
jgi:ABC-type siderophore export system fused ATPase/permease subunit